jgi:hypothetical protein
MPRIDSITTLIVQAHRKLKVQDFSRANNDLQKQFLQGDTGSGLAFSA